METAQSGRRPTTSCTDVHEQRAVIAQQEAVALLSDNQLLTISLITEACNAQHAMQHTQQLTAGINVLANACTKL